MELSSLLVFWYKKHGRSLPWRTKRDAYKIWLSEIILQQTRVEQGLSYYLKFEESYPEVRDLASAPLDEVLKLWQGLGYYTRARNLHRAAKSIVDEYGGRFPSSLAELKKLSGVGDYTAAAVASMAFGIPAAVVDGNVYRVLSRYFGIATPIDTPAGKKEFQCLAQELMDASDPGTHNQAIMDFGALVCTPQLPRCGECPLSAGCHAFSLGAPSSFPVKSKRIKVSTRYFHYLLLKHDNSIVIHQRQAKDIWHSLYEFPLICTNAEAGLAEISGTADWKRLLGDATPEVVEVSELIKHKLTHQTILCKFYLMRINCVSSLLGAGYKTIDVGELHKISVPKLIDNYTSRDHVKKFISNDA